MQQNTGDGNAAMSPCSQWIAWNDKLLEKMMTATTTAPPTATMSSCLQMEMGSNGTEMMGLTGEQWGYNEKRIATNQMKMGWQGQGQQDNKEHDDNHDQDKGDNNEGDGQPDSEDNPVPPLPPQ